MILSICSSNGIPCFREFPKIDDWLQWEGAFISSTSRGFLGINKIRLSDSELELPHCPLMETLSQLLTKEMKKMSVDVSVPFLEG